MAMEYLRRRAASNRARSVLLAGVLAAGALAAACSPAATAQGGSAAQSAAAPTPAPASAASPSAAAKQPARETQTREGGQVSVAVTWRGPEAGPVFEVVMDTHAVDLDGYDLRQLATLRTDQGKQAAPSEWRAPKGGHHRSGELVFPTQATDGSPLLGPGTRSIELIIRDVAGVPQRVYAWTL